jgi:hypothetical protein
MLNKKVNWLKKVNDWHKIKNDRTKKLIGQKKVKWLTQNKKWVNKKIKWLRQNKKCLNKKVKWQTMAEQKR